MATLLLVWEAEQEWQQNITTLELVPIMTTAAVWGQHWLGQMVLLPARRTYSTCRSSVKGHTTIFQMLPEILFMLRWWVSKNHCASNGYCYACKFRPLNPKVSRRSAAAPCTLLATVGRPIGSSLEISIEKWKD